MLLDSGLGQKFWAEATTTAAYLANRVPCRHMKMTPEELWSKIKPNLAHLRIFGCKALAHIPKVKRNKLSPTSMECNFNWVQ